MADERKRARPSPWTRAFDWVIRTDSLVCEIALVGMMLLISAEVFCRSLFNYSLQLTDEVSGYLLVAVTFLGISVSLKDGGFFRVDFLYRRFPFRVRAHLECVFHVVALIFTSVLDYQLFRLIASSYEREIRSPTLLATPLYLPQLVMPVGVSVMVLLLLVETGRRFMALFTPEGDRGS